MEVARPFVAPQVLDSMACVESSTGRVAHDKVSVGCGCEDSELIKVSLDRGSRRRAFGMRLIDMEIAEAGLSIVRINDGGALSMWNARKPSLHVAPGDSIIELNGFTEPWAIMGEVSKAITVEMVVRRAPPRVRALLARCEVSDESIQATKLVLKHTTLAGDFSADTCAICMEDIEADERVAGLKCGHGFHQKCLMRWLGRPGTSGCPLCRGAVR
jgi:hypothetical protein